MLVSELEIGQEVTVEHWFINSSGDDCSIVTGIVNEKLECYGSACLKVTNTELGGRNWKYLWINDKDKILSINN